MRYFNIQELSFRFKSVSMSSFRLTGAACGLYLLKGFPSWSMRNLAKFQRMLDDPSLAGSSLLRKENTSLVPAPFTSPLANQVTFS
mmetsp:Transcript_17829/g.20322  ORF Transcript_17829/g.20322 Transcript_17829/m.20322 type:complete len:86 (-) Transcript_17829:499-756(-)